MPRILLFSINRVNYDVKQKKLVKNNKRFDFEKIVYADKFLYQNRQKDEEMNEQIKQLREKQRVIRDKIKHYKDFYKGQSLLEIMDVTKAFIDSQSEDFLDIDQNGDDSICNHEDKSPTQLGKLGLKTKDIKKAVRVIEAY